MLQTILQNLFKKSILIGIFLCIRIIAFSFEWKDPILPGAFQTGDYFPMITGKNIGIVANQTSLIGQTHLVDSLVHSGFSIKKVFAPEHGFRGDKSAGEEVFNSTDVKTGIPIISLYGKHLAPDSADLSEIEIMIFDIQDVGVRFFTYISTLQLVMESCAKWKVPLIVLDRPNPNGFYIDGPVLEKKEFSFVGMQPVPIVYGMTIGEYAGLLNGEGWLRNKLKCNLTVIQIKNYDHSSRYDLPVKPSPNLPDMDAVYLYPSVCLFEGTNISLGRGTLKPFRLIGYPGNKKGEVKFTPEEIEGVAHNPPYEDTLCTGLDLSGKGKQTSEERQINLKWLMKMYSDYPKKEKFFNNFFEKLGGKKLKIQIIKNSVEEKIRKSWMQEIDRFKKLRKKYLLYVDFE